MPHSDKTQSPAAHSDPPRASPAAPNTASHTKPPTMPTTHLQHLPPAQLHPTHHPSIKPHTRPIPLILPLQNKIPLPFTITHIPIIQKRNPIRLQQPRHDRIPRPPKNIHPNSRQSLLSRQRSQKKNERKAQRTSPRVRTQGTRSVSCRPISPSTQRDDTSCTRAITNSPTIDKNRSTSKTKLTDSNLSIPRHHIPHATPSTPSASSRPLLSTTAHAEETPMHPLYENNTTPPPSPTTSHTVPAGHQQIRPLPTRQSTRGTTLTGTPHRLASSPPNHSPKPSPPLPHTSKSPPRLLHLRPARPQHHRLASQLRRPRPLRLLRHRPTRPGRTPGRRTPAPRLPPPRHAARPPLHFTVEANFWPTPILITNVPRQAILSTDPNPAEGRPAGLYGNRFADAPADAIRKATHPHAAHPLQHHRHRSPPPRGTANTPTRQIRNILNLTACTAHAPPPNPSPPEPRHHHPHWLWAAALTAENRTP